MGNLSFPIECKKATKGNEGQPEMSLREVNGH